MRLFSRLALALIPALTLAIAFPLTATAVQIPPAARTTTIARSSVRPYASQPIKFPARGTQVNGSLVGGKNPPKGTGDLVYYGGPVLRDPKIYVIFWGSSWNSGSDATAKQVILNFFHDVGNTRFNNLLTQYYDTAGNINNDISFQASYVDTTFASTNSYCGGQTTVFDHALPGDPTNIDVENEVVNVAQSQGWPLDAANGLYFVYLPAGTYLNDGAPSSPVATGCSDTSYTSNAYCSYHAAFPTSANPTTDYAYAAMPYPLWTQGCANLPAHPNGMDNVGDAEVNLSSHEMSNAITDPLPAGPSNNGYTAWMDSSGLEIVNKCQWDFSDGPTSLNNGGSFEVQSEYSNASSDCASDYGTPSKTWYFAEGYTGTGFAEYLTLANPNIQNANVTVNYLIQSGTPVQKTYVVNATSRRTITVNNEIGDGHSVSMVVTSDLPIVAERPMYFTYSSPYLSVAVPGGSDVVGANSLGTSYNFGYIDTSTDHDTYLTILNQNNSTMTVTMNFYAAAGGAAIQKTKAVNANSRGTVKVDEIGLPQGSYSALVSLDQPGLVERPMYLIDAITHNAGSADVVGVPTTSQSWYFAEGYTGPTFSERYILSAPATTSSTSATVTFIDGKGNSTPVNVTIPAGGQTVVNANDVLPLATNNSAVVTADQPIIAERFQSFDYTGPVGNQGTSNVPGATDVLGSTKPATQFYFAEGYTGGLFGEYITVENPNATQIFVTFKFLPSNGGAPVVIQQNINANTRFTLNVNKQAGLSETSLSAVVQSTLPIVAERPMYYSYSALGVTNATGGSDVVGYQP